MTIVQASNSEKMRRTIDWRMPEAGPTSSGKNLGRKRPQGVDTDSRFELYRFIGI